MLGDGIRRNIATVTKEERDRFLAAILKLNDSSDPTMKYSDGVTFFAKQEWVHWAGHTLAHAGSAFMGWHRELCNRFEALLRVVDPQLSLYYWDWTTDPRDQIDSDGNHFSLFTPDFMGDDGHGAINRVPSDGGGDAGPPFANFATIVNGGSPPPGTVLKAGVTLTGDHADLPGHSVIWRAVGPAGVPATNLNPQAIATQKPVPPTPNPNSGPPLAGTVAQANNGAAVASDHDIVTAGDALAQAQQFGAFLNAIKSHNYVHQYFSGTMGTEHVSLGDPFFFLMHSNLDRLWALWQRAVVAGVPQSWRLDPNQTYGASNGSLADSFPPWDGTPGVLLANPLVPWVPGSHADDTVNDGFINSVGGLIANHAIVSKTAKDASVVIPPSYDTAPHSSYIIVNRDTFSTSEVSAKGSPAVFPSAFYVIYEGFAPKELGATSSPLPTVPPNLPSFIFTGASNISAVNPSALYENPSGTIDMPQRITISFDLRFANASDFPPPPPPGGQVVVNMRASLSYNVDTGTGGMVVPMTEIANTTLLLVNQPNPYMIDVDAAAQNPHWLSFDTRVFQVTEGSSILGVTQGSDPFAFLPSALSSLRTTPSKFETELSADEDQSVLELSQAVGGKNVFNYAVARVRYLAPLTIDATSVQVFFRVFSTLVSALDYDSANPVGVTTGNYRRTGNTSGSMPLLGIQTDQSGNGEVASIPCFAEARIANMSNQTDGNNTQTINGGGATEQEAFFGCWLDINQPGALFPRNPLTDSGGPNGPFTGSGGPKLSIQQLITGHHQCLVAEIFFWPSGTASDPIHLHATPGSSDRLAQRNLSIVPSSNPSWPDAHTIQHTFLIKPSVIAVNEPVGITALAMSAAAGLPAEAMAKHSKTGKQAAEVEAAARYRGPDELIVRWNNIPRDSTATIFLPEVEVDEILALSALRQHPQVLSKVDAHTLSCRLADVTFIPLPGARKGTLAGLLSLRLPPTVKTGQVFRLSVEQYSGYTRKTLGAFQITIPVKTDPEILPNEIRKLSVLRYIQQTIPVGNRWYSIFERYLDQIAARVRGLGGDPDVVKPSPEGGEGGQVPPPEPAEHCVTGKVSEVIYDCFGDFEAFVVEDCDKSHRFFSRQPGIEAVVRRACRERSTLTVCTEGRRIRRIVVECS